MIYPSARDYAEVAAEILATTPEQVQRLPNFANAESALAAPMAGFGDHDVYPTLHEKAAVLLERLARNHPLPDGNKRAAFTTAGLFLELNGSPLSGEDEADVEVVERIAAGERSHPEIVAWLRERTGDA